MGKEKCSACPGEWEDREDGEDQRCPKCGTPSVSAKAEYDRMFAEWKRANPQPKPAAPAEFHRCKCCEAALEGDYDFCGKCENGECQECCEHGDTDDYCCLTCGKELMEDRMAAAYDYAKDRRKYGD